MKSFLFHLLHAPLGSFCRVVSDNNRVPGLFHFPVVNSVGVQRVWVKYPYIIKRGWELGSKSSHHLELHFSLARSAYHGLSISFFPSSFPGRMSKSIGSKYITYGGHIFLRISLIYWVMFSAVCHYVT